MKRRPSPAPLSQRQRAALSDMDQRMRVRAMLEQRCSVTPIGPRTILTLETGGRGEFPSEMVEQVQREMGWRS